MNWFVDALRHNPELAIFLTLALGFLVGRLKIGGFSVGTVVGTLLAGVLIGQLDIKVPAIVKTVFFDLFLFTTGYKVGPQFFRALKKDAVSQVALTVVLCVTCLVSAFVAAKLLGYDMGTAAGLLAGAFSESTVIGTAAEHGDARGRCHRGGHAACGAGGARRQDRARGGRPRVARHPRRDVGRRGDEQDAGRTDRGRVGPPRGRPRRLLAEARASR